MVLLNFSTHIVSMQGKKNPKTTPPLPPPNQTKKHFASITKGTVLREKPLLGGLFLAVLLSNVNLERI